MADWESSEEVEWIKRNIKRRECSRFVEVPQNAEDGLGPEEHLCQCGNLISQHEQYAWEGKQGEIPTGEWTVNTHTRTEVTNAFGLIEFCGYGDKVAKYARVDVNTNMNLMLNLLMKKWGLVRPNLLISVTGGAKSFHMKSRLKKVFRQGLRKAALSTGAWIITGGTNTGVMKYVGEAVRDFGVTSTAKQKVITIGIVSWGCVQGKDALIDKSEDCIGKWPAEYEITKEEGNNECFLDPNHSHFILVDNGTRHKFGGEIPFRARLEKEISSMKTNTGQDAVAVPVALLVLAGGPGTLETCKSSILNKTPTVVVKGSGKAADILAYAFQNSAQCDCEENDSSGTNNQNRSIITPELETEIREMVIKEYGDKDVSKRVDWIKQCLCSRDMITVFELDSKDSEGDIDMAILKALFKANKNEMMNQLKLALVWNRIDVAKSEIFTDDRHWPAGSLNDVMLSALRLDRVDFVELFLDNGIILKDFLLVKEMVYLYNTTGRYTLLYNLLMHIKGKKRRHFSLADVGNLLKDLIGDYYRPMYLTEQKYRNLDVDEMMNDLRPMSLKLGLMETAELVANTPKSAEDMEAMKFLGVKRFQRPIEQELFIWAVLSNRQELAKFFWKRGVEQIAAALIANNILRAMKHYTDDAELKHTLGECASEFEDLAMGVLNECHSIDEKRAQDLLVREIPNWGRVTVVLIAIQGENMKFVLQRPCQSLVTDIWMGKMLQETSVFRILPSIVFFPLILSMIKFQHEDRSRFESLTYTDADGNKSKRLSENYPLLPRLDSTSSNTEQQEYERKQQKKMTSLQKISHFYQTPVVTFYLNVIFYLVFLGLYSYILLVEFADNFTVWEALLIAWVCTIFIEEIRQVASSSAKSLKAKVITYFDDSWNILDVITIVLFVMGMILRFIPSQECLEAARIILCLNLVSFFMRTLHIFSVSKQLGPKLVMIKGMMADLLSFLVILMVFIVAYAVTSEAILYPQTSRDASLVFYIMKRAYWTVYGELFLDETEITDGCTNDPLMYRNHTMQRCPTSFGKWLVPILMGIYIMLTNVLLLNLLIAIFSYTFQNIQDNTDLHWSFQRFRLVVEYHLRPALPPPFIIISHVFRLARMMLVKLNCLGIEASTDLRKRFENKLEEKQLVQWENMTAETFVSNRETTEMESVEYTVRASLSKLEGVLEKVDEIHETNDASEMSGRLNRLETKMDHAFLALDWIIKSLSEHKMGALAPPPKLRDLAKLKQTSHL